MKIFKTKQFSFFPRPFGIRNKLYLSVGVLALFDLTDASSLLTEQELWQELPKQLGTKPILDQGIPKPRGEFLVTGSCHAPRGETRQASQVRVRLGQIDKKLNVYGDRYWKNGDITEAEPFVEMPVVWPNAYGGEGFDRNPQGKGKHKVIMPDGSKARPLPNIELPSQQIGASYQESDPGGFGPLDLMWPQRFKKNGTYDQKWQSERWPYFPDDMDYEFFNMACEDQFNDGYFAGGEPLVIENMHPDMPVIESSLPRLRVRTFVTLDTAYKPHRFPVGSLPSHQLSETDEFREVPTRLETVWLFPSILRGMVLYRGSTEIVDEEGRDVLRVLIRHEDLADEPKPIEFYREEQIKLLDRGVDMDMSPFEDAAQKAKASMLKLKNIPKFADNIRHRALGKRPSMPMPTPEETLATTKTQLAGHMARIDSLEAMATKLHAEHGHLVKVDLDVFNRFREKIANIGQQVEQTSAKMAETQKKLEATRAAAVKEVSGRISKLDPKPLKEAGIDPDTVLSEDFPFNRPVNPWHDRGFPFVVECRKRLADDSETLRQLKGMGLTRDTIHKAWMGVNDAERMEAPADWGLDEGPEFALPSGIVLPRFDGPVLNRILCAPGDVGDDNFFLVPGSDEEPLFLPSATLIDLPTMPAAQGAPIVAVADELQGLFLEQEVGDCCSIIVLPTPGDTPGDEAAKALKEAQTFLIVMPHEWEKEPSLKQTWAEWQGAYDAAESLELEHGNSLFQSRQQGSDIRQWVLDHLPKDYGKEHAIDLGLPKPGQPPGEGFLGGLKLEFPDIGGLVKGLYDELHQAMEAKFAPLKAEQATIMQQVKDVAAKAVDKGAKIDLDNLLKPPSGPKMSPSQIGQSVAQSIREKRDRIKTLGGLTPELEKAFNEEAAKAEALGAKSEALKSKLGAMKESLELDLDKQLKELEAKSVPDKAKEKLAQYGLDPDAIKPLTREEVQRLHDQGKSLAGAILSGVDLSGLNLEAANMQGCQLKGTDFTGTVLDNANLDQVMAGEAVFTKASLKSASMERGMFGKGVFKECDLTGAKAHQAVFKAADFTDATLVGIEFDMAILEKTNFTGANLSEARINMCMISGKADKADFRTAHITKCIFKKMTLHEANFSQAAIHQSLFNGTEGARVNFHKADLDKLRTGRNAQFPEANLAGATLREAGIRETDLSGSDFRGSNLESAMLEECRLVNAKFNGASCKHARFTKSNLEGASLLAANLFMGGLRKARLVNTDLRGSNLYAVDFYKAVLGKTRFDGANLKKSQLENRLDLLDEES